MAYQLSRPLLERTNQNFGVTPRTSRAREMFDRSQKRQTAAREAGDASKSEGMTPPQMPGPAPGVLQRTPPQSMARPTTPNLGGTITRNGVAQTYAPTPARDPAMNSGGTIQRGQQRVVVPPSQYVAPLAGPSATPVQSPTTSAAPQTESRNPLTGTGNQQPQGSTGTLPQPPVARPQAAAMGFSSRGSVIPTGRDAMADGGGNAPGIGAEPTAAGGPLQRRFATPESQAFYDRVVRSLFNRE